MKKIILFFLIFNITKAKTIYLKSDPWCPYACDSIAKNQGIVVDIVRAILAKHGVEVNYTNTNFARVIKEAREGLIEGVVGCAKEDAPDFVFPSINQAEAIFQYFALKDSKFVYKNLDSLKNMRVGVINGYTYDKETTEQMQKNNPSFLVISGELGLNQLIKLLEQKRIDAIVESGAVFSTFLHNNNINNGHFKMVGSPKQIPQKIYVCFSPKFPEAKTYTKMIDEGMKELSKTGELKKIIEKYNIQ